MMLNFLRKFIGRLYFQLHYFVYRIIDKIKGTNLYQADSDDVIKKISTSWYSTAFYPGLMNRIAVTIPFSEVTGLLDLGCGKGLALIKFYDKGIKNIGGVELREDIFNICCNNLKLLNINPSLLLNEDASLIKDFGDFNCIFFFNPFPCKIMSIVISNLVRYFSQTNMKLYIIYINPVCHILLTDNNFVVIDEFVAPISNFKVTLYQFN